MKVKVIYFISVLATCLSGCLKNNPTPATPLPTGTFSGQFIAIRRPPDVPKKDTVKATLMVSLSQTLGFTVTGDTTKHAGSFGDYGVNAYNIQFVDQSGMSAKPPKYHLSGIYNYTYDGSILEIYINYADTVSLSYIFKKTN
jgi:hypothetical protein